MKTDVKSYVMNVLLRLWKFAEHHKGFQISYATKFMFR